MKTNTSMYGVVALISFAVASVFSYLWSVSGAAAYGIGALALMGVFTWASATVIGEVERREKSTVKNVDFTRTNLNKAA